jgi:hypothetical protein
MKVKELLEMKPVVRLQKLKPNAARGTISFGFIFNNWEYKRLIPATKAICCKQIQNGPITVRL